MSGFGEMTTLVKRRHWGCGFICEAARSSSWTNCSRKTGAVTAPWATLLVPPAWTMVMSVMPMKPRDNFEVRDPSRVVRLIGEPVVYSLPLAMMIVTFLPADL